MYQGKHHVVEPGSHVVTAVTLEGKIALLVWRRGGRKLPITVVSSRADELKKAHPSDLTLILQGMEAKEDP